MELRPITKSEIGEITIRVDRLKLLNSELEKWGGPVYQQEVDNINAMLERLCDTYIDILGRMEPVIIHE